MGRYTDYAPIENTCPMIDDVISTLLSIDWNLEDENECELNQRFIRLQGVMEDIRCANSTLREWGNEQFKTVMDLEKEVQEKNETISVLQIEIEQLKKDIEYYEQLQD